ncbi:polyprenyl synthetase family protein [Alkaliphilus oremlandii]|uniref:Farnesyl diphosphate synthase n=1 Tax=Alkaliphilus oremlandii (strain OhILAs) TaxID=350688 RepID=A8MFI9_ALKOO|nr:farnesyl diphosphate synthase [Alkaliphilus oremlandii]ABW19152.1 Polyprenyl synthetase [Alkaliphilus oremlandii OhILAs]
MTFREQLQHYIDLTNEHLKDYFNMKEGYNQTLIESMKYSLFAGGKRLRPILSLASYQMFRDDIEEVMPYACGIEMIHTYSLIHDDLPAMDNDDYRRGKLTNHKVYNEGVAILAGDGLLNYSFELMLENAIKQNDIYKHIVAIKEISNSAGVHGMIGGQVVDLESENKIIDKEMLDYIHINKTAALITTSLKVGAIIAGAQEEDIRNMEKVGLNLGLAFQIKDDILDVVGDEAKLGKSIGRDLEKHKSTYPALIGLEASIEKVGALTNNVKQLLHRYSSKAEFLLELCDYLTSRES